MAQEKLNIIKKRIREEQKESKSKYTSFEELTVDLDNHFAGLKQDMTDRLQRLNTTISRRFPNLDQIQNRSS